MIKNAIDWLSRPFGNSAVKGKPLAVIGGSFGQYGGVWAHDETRKSFGIAGARVVEAVKLSVPFKTLEGKAPAEHAELSANVRDVVGKLAAEVSADKSAVEAASRDWRLCWLRAGGVRAPSTGGRGVVGGR